MENWLTSKSFKFIFTEQIFQMLLAYQNMQDFKSVNDEWKSSSFNTLKFFFNLPGHLYFRARLS